MGSSRWWLCMSLKMLKYALTNSAFPRHTITITETQCVCNYIGNSSYCTRKHAISKKILLTSHSTLVLLQNNKETDLWRKLPLRGTEVLEASDEQTDISNAKGILTGLCFQHNPYTLCILYNIRSEGNTYRIVNTLILQENGKISAIKKRILVKTRNGQTECERPLKNRCKALMAIRFVTIMTFRHCFNIAY